MASLLDNLFNGGVVKSSQFHKLNTAINVREFINPALSAEPNGATISALAHGPYLTIDVSNWSSSNPIIRIANPFSFAIVDFTVHVRTAFTASSGDPYVAFLPGSSTLGAIQYVNVGTSGSLVRNTISGYYKSLHQEFQSIFGVAEPQAGCTRLNSQLNLKATGTGLGGTFSGTFNFKILPIAESRVILGGHESSNYS
tara:strand:- start:1184 stop:1777 length:594 start_codon:yes stop_codon:yes gene_type:complete